MVMQVESQILEWFDHFHENPEVSWGEHETTKKIAEILDEMKVPYKSFS